MNKMKFLLPKEKRKNRKHCRRSGAQCPSARACKVDAPSPKPRALLHKNTGVIGIVIDAPVPVLVPLVFLLFFHGASSFQGTLCAHGGKADKREHNETVFDKKRENSRNKKGC